MLDSVTKGREARAGSSLPSLTDPGLIASLNKLPAIAANLTAGLGACVLGVLA